MQLTHFLKRKNHFCLTTLEHTLPKQILKNKKAETYKGSSGKVRKWKGLVSWEKISFLNLVGYHIQTQVQWNMYFFLSVHTLAPFPRRTLTWIVCISSSILYQILTKDEHTTPGRLIRANKIWLGLLFKPSGNTALVREEDQVLPENSTIWTFQY